MTDEEKDFRVILDELERLKEKLREPREYNAKCIQLATLAAEFAAKTRQLLIELSARPST